MDDPLGMATPAPPADLGDEESLMFMTHAPGAVVPPRLEDMDVNESFAGKILGKFGIGPAAPKGPAQKEEDESSQTLSGRLAEGAGRGAFDRAMRAGRAKPKKPAERPEWADQHVSSRGGGTASTGRQVVGGAPVGSPVAAGGPGFMGMLPGGLFAPLRGTPVTVVHVILFALALLLLELSPVLGLLACVVAAAEVVSLRVRIVRESCAGRDKIAWPDVAGLFSAVLPFLAAVMGLVPGVVLGLVAFGPVAFQADGKASVQARAARIIDPVPAEGDKVPEVVFGQSTLLMLDAAIGTVGADGPIAGSRPMTEVAQHVADSARLRAETFVDFGNASGIGITARVLALLALAYFPMALLCSIRIRSAYAAVHIPMILRSIFRALGPYLVVLFLFAAQLIATLAVLFLLPVQVAGMGPAGHLIWVVALATVLVALPMAQADLLGRLYRSKQLSLGWD